MSILVVGGSGFIGSNLVAKLIDRGINDVKVLDIRQPLRADDFRYAGVRYHVADIRDRRALELALEGVTEVVHLAADTRVTASVANPLLNFDVNVVGSLNLLEAMRSLGIFKLVNASTSGAMVGNWPGALDEDVPPAPLAPYGSSKLAVEGYCSSYSASYGMQITSLRIANVFGPRSLHKESVVAAFFTNIIAGKPIVIYGDGAQTRDFVYVDDICEGILLALENTVSGPVQLGSGVPTSLNELIGYVEQVVGFKITKKYCGPRLGEIRNTYCNIAKARALLGFEPSIDFVGNLRQTWNWFNEFSLHSALHSR